MSKLGKVVEKVVQMRTVECPYCGLRVTVKNPRWKRVTCKGCGHKINVPFSRQYVEEKIVYERVKARNSFGVMSTPVIRRAQVNDDV